MKYKTFFIFIICIIITLGILGVYWVKYLQTAHSTFVNYYKFRGCTQLLDKTDTYGTCKLSSGKVIKIVKYNNKWYLDGDLPSCWHSFCL